MEEELRFEPTVEELVSHYLKNKILGNWSEDLSQFFVDGEIYGKDKTPWEAFNFDGNQLPWLSVVDEFGFRRDSIQFLHVFTRLQNVGRSGTKQKVRVAGNGSWHMDRTKPQYGLGDQVIGYCKVFTFVPDDQEIETPGQWSMNEYTIEPAAFPELRGIMCDNFVLCKIKRDDNKYCKGKGGKRANKRPRFESNDHHPLQAKKKQRLINAHKPLHQGSEIIDTLDEPEPEPEPVCEVVDEPVNESVCEIVDEPVNGAEKIIEENCQNDDDWVVEQDLSEMIDILLDEPVSEVVDDELVNGGLGEDWVADFMKQYQGENLSDPNLCFNTDDLGQLLTCGVG